MTAIQKFILFLFFISVLNPGDGKGQSLYKIKGRVTDAATGEGVPFASVAIMASISGGNTDFDGYYEISYTPPADSIFVTSVGYRRSTKGIVRNQAEQTVDFQVTAEPYALREVVVRAGENPAWAVIRKVVAARKANNPDRQTASQ